MAAVCDICGKKPSFGMNVSHSHRRTKRRWNPNVQRVRAVVDGAPKRLHVCTSCIRAGKVTKPLRRNYQPSARRARAAQPSVCCQPNRASGAPLNERSVGSATHDPDPHRRAQPRGVEGGFESFLVRRARR